MAITRAKSKRMGEDKCMGKSAGNDKCVLKRTDKKYKCTVKHMQMADSQFAPTRTRAKIIKKGKQSH